VLGELLAQPLDGALALAAEHPHHQAERPHVLGAQGLLGAELERGDGLEGELGDVDLQQAVGAEAVVVERAAVVAGLLQVAGREGAGVDHQHAADLEVAEIDA
jgi:hypothetical protein